MITVFYPKGLIAAQGWEEKLQELTVPYLMIETQSDSPWLRESKREFHGSKAIDDFLKEYATLMTNWNQDRCDMWFFEK